MGQNLDDTLTDIGDAGAQAAQAMRNVEALLGEAGAGLADIAKLILYITDRAHLAPARAAGLPHLGTIPCPLSEIIVNGPPPPPLAMEVHVFPLPSPSRHLPTK